MNNPLISIITPVYNGEATIEETINSVINQSYINWELIIVNDGSTDSTLNIIKRYQCDNIIVIDSNNRGVAYAKNLGVKNSNGDYLLPLDADDTLEIEYLSICMREFQRDGNLKLVYTEANLIGEAIGPWILPKYNYSIMLRYNMVYNCALFLKDDFNRVGGYRTNMVDGLEDWDFWIALLSKYKNCQVKKVSQPLYNYRVSISSRNANLVNSLKFESMLENIVFNNFDIYKTYFPNIHTRILKYDYHIEMINKWPIKIMVNLLNFFHEIRTKMRI